MPVRFAGNETGAACPCEGQVVCPVVLRGSGHVRALLLVDVFEDAFLQRPFDRSSL